MVYAGRLAVGLTYASGFSPKPPTKLPTPHGQGSSARFASLVVTRFGVAVAERGVAVSTDADGCAAEPVPAPAATRAAASSTEMQEQKRLKDVFGRTEGRTEAVLSVGLGRERVEPAAVGLPAANFPRLPTAQQSPKRCKVDATETKPEGRFSGRLLAKLTGSFITTDTPAIPISEARLMAVKGVVCGETGFGFEPKAVG